MKKLYKAANIILILFFVALILMRIFYKLGDIGWQDIDEAKHASEAYETFKSGNWIVHLYNWEVDYVSSKPPLYYWLTNIVFGIFGISVLNVKLPSAIAGTILCIVLAVFVFRQLKNRFNSTGIALSGILLYLSVFITMDLLYDYHMIRTANFDSVYVLFILAGMLFMIRASKDNRFLIPFGAFMGLAFLSKGFNVSAIVFCAICCIPFLAKEKRVKYILYSILTAVLVVLPWAALRFRFDGTKYFYYMSFWQAGDKVEGPTWDFFEMMPRTLTFRLVFYGLIFYIVALTLKHRSVKQLFGAVMSDLKEYRMLWTWFWAPIIFYSLMGSFNEWYVYSSFVVGAVLTGIYAAIGIDALSGLNIPVQVIATFSLCIIMAVAAKDGIDRLGSYWLAGNGGGPNLPFWADVREIKEKYGDEYRGSNVYIEDIDHYVDLEYVPIEEANTTQTLFFDLLAYGELEYDWRGMPGGVDAWEQDDEGILVINKDIFDRFYDRVAGHVIIEDGGYLYFIRDMY